MKISNIRFHGNHNILDYAIANEADILHDNDLISIISQDTSVSITLKDVQFFELFPLLCRYRDKITIHSESDFSMPTSEFLNKHFPKYKNDEGKMTPVSKMVQMVIDNFFNLHLQMKADANIISPFGASLFIPLMCRTSEIEIPISFEDLMIPIREAENAKLENPSAEESEIVKLFDNPNFSLDMLSKALIEESLNKPNNPTTIFNQLMLAINRMVYIDDRKMEFSHMDNLNNAFRYSLLPKNPTDKLYSFAPIGFFKIDRNIKHSVNFFKGNQEDLNNKIDVICHIDSPLFVQFVASMPLLFMSALLRVSPDTIQIDSIGSNYTIISNGIRTNNFTLPIDNSDGSINHTTENISAYIARIEHAHSVAFNTIKALLDSMNSYPTLLMNVLPPIYSNRCLITIDSEKIQGVKASPLNIEMLADMIKVIDGLKSTIYSS